MYRFLLFAVLAAVLQFAYSAQTGKEVYNVPIDVLEQDQLLPEIEEATYEILSVALADERIQKYEVLEMNVRFKQPLYMDPNQLKPSASLLSALQSSTEASPLAYLGRFANEREFFENARHPLNHVLHLQCNKRWFAPLNMTESAYCAEQQHVHHKDGRQETMEYYQRLRKAGVMDDCGLREPGVRPADRDSDDLEALLYSAQPVVIPRFGHETDEALRSKSLHGAKRAAQPLITMLSLLSNSAKQHSSTPPRAINFPIDAFSPYASQPQTGALEGFTAYFLMSFTAPPVSAAATSQSTSGSNAVASQPPRLFRVITPEEAANCALWILPTREFPLRITAESIEDIGTLFPHGRIPLMPAQSTQDDEQVESSDENSAMASSSTVTRNQMSSLTQVALAHAATAGIKHELRSAALAIGLESAFQTPNSDPLYALEQAQARATTLQATSSLETASFIEMESPFIGRAKPLSVELSKTASNFGFNKPNEKRRITRSLLSPSARKRFSDALLARASELSGTLTGKSTGSRPNTADASPHDISQEAAARRLSEVAARVAQEAEADHLNTAAQTALQQQRELEAKAREAARQHALAIQGETPIVIANDPVSQKRASEHEAAYQRAQIEALRQSKKNLDNLSAEEEAVLLELEAPRFDETPQDTQERLEAARERLIATSMSDDEFRRAISDRPMQELATIFFETANKIDATMASGVATQQVLSAIVDPIVEMVPPVLAEVSMQLLLPAFVEIAKNTMGDSANKFFLPPDTSDKMPMPIYTQMPERSLVLPYGMDGMKHSAEVDESAPGEKINYAIDFTSKATIASRLLNFLIAEPLRESLDIMHGSLTANMFAHLNRTVTRRAARALSVALTQSLGSQLTRMSLNIFTKAFTVHPAQSLTRILSSTLTNTVALTLTRALTRAPVADIMCELCRKGAEDYEQSAEHVQEYCDACWSAEVAGQSQEYYTAYYANYYNWYYTHHYGGYYARHFAEGYFSKNRVGGHKE